MWRTKRGRSLRSAAPPTRPQPNPLIPARAGAEREHRAGCGVSCYPAIHRARVSRRMREPILVINAGSSSIKFSVFETGADGSLAAGAHGQVSAIGGAARFEVADAQGRE